jgi:NAD(P)-dependent dehydrogenase (short-subunit alcohol dehydrogenase family)
MIEPPPLSRIAGAQCFMPSKGPVRLTAKVRFQASRLVSTMSARAIVPALLTRMWSLPKRLSAAATVSFHAAGLTAHPDPAYTASKWGLRGLTKTAVLQFSQWNIRVNSIHPGQIADTGFYRSAGEAFAHAARTAIPMHRQGTPKECADLVLFLASDESSFISGAEIAIDGGYFAAGLASLRNRLREDFASGRN